MNVFKYPMLVRCCMNVWPPFLFCGIRYVFIASNYQHVKLELKFSSFTKNANRTQYGGSIFSMTDTVYSLMLMANLGERYLVWDKFADVDFIQPGRSKLTTEAKLDQQDIAEIREKTQHGDKYLPNFTFYIKDEAGNLVAKVNRTLYIRLKANYRPKKLPSNEND